MLGSSLNPSIPPLLPHCAQFYESHMDPGQRVSAIILPEERFYCDATVLHPLIILTLTRQWPCKARLHIPVLIVWHLNCNITML